MRIYLAAAALALLSGCAQAPVAHFAQTPTVWTRAYAIPTLTFDSADSFADHAVRLMDPDYSYHGNDRT